MVIFCQQGVLKEKPGSLRDTGTNAKLTGTFYASELAGRTDALPVTNSNFSMSVYIPGESRSGRGTPGRPGYTGSGVRLNVLPVLKNWKADHNSSKYRASRTLAVFGKGVTEEDLAAAGIDLADAHGTSRNVRFEIHADVDHDVEFGIYAFNRKRPWAGTQAWLYRATYKKGGRQHFDWAINYWAPPPANTIWVPYIYTKQGEDELTIKLSSY